MIDQVLNESGWYGGRHPSQLTAQQFMDLHCTGKLPDATWDSCRSVLSFRWLGTPARFPRLRDALQTRLGEISLRQTGERLHYVRRDANGNVLRDAQGIALEMAEAEVLARGWSVYNDTIVAFLGDRPIGMIWTAHTAMLVCVAERYQRCGIGRRLVRLQLETCPGTRLGKMTPAGMVLARAVHRSYLAPEQHRSTNARR